MPNNYLLQPIEESIIEKPDKAHEVLLKFIGEDKKDYIVLKIKKFKVEELEAQNISKRGYLNDNLSDLYKVFAESVMIGLESGVDFWMKPNGKGV